MKRNWGLVFDEIAIPFWLILIAYSIYEITHGNPRAWIVLVVMIGALIVDSSLVIISTKKKKK